MPTKEEKVLNEEGNAPETRLKDVHPQKVKKKEMPKIKIGNRLVRLDGERDADEQEPVQKEFRRRRTKTKAYQWRTEMGMTRGVEVCFCIMTSKGPVFINDGDYVVESANGEFYPISESDFEHCYDELEPDDTVEGEN